MVSVEEYGLLEQRKLRLESLYKEFEEVLDPVSELLEQEEDEFEEEEKREDAPEIRSMVIRQTN